VIDLDSQEPFSCFLRASATFKKE